MVYDLSFIGDDRMVGGVTPTDRPTDGWTETKQGKVSPHRGRYRTRLEAAACTETGAVHK